MASSIIQSGENPAVFDNKPNNDAIFSLTDGSFSWNKRRYCYLDTLFSSNQQIGTWDTKISKEIQWSKYSKALFLNT